MKTDSMDEPTGVMSQDGQSILTRAEFLYRMEGMVRYCEASGDMLHGDLVRFRAAARIIREDAATINTLRAEVAAALPAVEAMDVLAACVREELSELVPLDEVTINWGYRQGGYEWDWIVEGDRYISGEGPTLAEAIIAATAKLREWEAKEMAERAEDEAEEAEASTPRPPLTPLDVDPVAWTREAEARAHAQFVAVADATTDGSEQT